MTRYTGPLFDADNHYYEAHDALTRHVPKAMQRRCVQWVTMEDGRQYNLVGGKLNRTTNPTFNPISKPGVLREFFRGNPNNKTTGELIRSALEPLAPEYMDRDARLALLDKQGLDAAWLFPTLAILYEEPLKYDVDAVTTLYGAFNQWLEDDWGYNYKDRLFSAPYISLADVDWACREVDKVLAKGARVLVMRPSAVYTKDGPRNPGAKEFDPFWARVNEAGITVVVHIGQTRHESNGYDHKVVDTLGMGERPTITNFHRARNINDFLASMIFDRLFERFPNVRVASVENGSEFLPGLLRYLEKGKSRALNYYKHDPVETFRRHVWINPFWEDDIAEMVELMGPDRVIIGSDWPHMEGLESPDEMLDEVKGLPLDVQAKVLHDNAAALNQLVGAKQSAMA